VKRFEALQAVSVLWFEQKASLADSHLPRIFVTHKPQLLSTRR
jgi:hypothetical protein